MEAVAEKKQVWRYGVEAWGVKKRCRRVDIHHDEGRKGLMESSELDEKLAVELAKKWVSQNMKSCQRAFAVIRLWTIAPNGFEVWEPFSKPHNVRIPLQ